jgi:hypothetical protein
MAYDLTTRIRLAFALITLLPCAAGAPAQSAPPGGAGAAVAIAETGAPEPPHLVTLVLQRRDELQLTDQQVKDLEGIRSEFRKQALQSLTEVRLAELKRDELLEQKPLNAPALTEQIKKIDELKIKIHAANLEFIGRVGAKLTDAQLERLEPLITAAITAPASSTAPDLREQIRSALKEQFEQQDVVEIKTTQAITTRLIDWAKAFGIVIGIPLGILLTVLGLLGVKTYKDFKKKVSAVGQEIDKSLQTYKGDINAKLTEAHKNAADVKAEADKVITELRTEAGKITGEMRTEAGKITAEFVGLKSQLAAASALSKDVKELASKVKNIETFVLESSPELTPEVSSLLDSALRSFQKYFQDLGFTPDDPDESVKVHLDPQRVFTARFNPNNNEIEIAPILAKDTDVMFRLYAHYILVLLAGDVQKEWKFPHRAIESGLSFYYASSYNDKNLYGDKVTPLLREQFPQEMARNPNVRVYNLDNVLKLDGNEWAQPATDPSSFDEMEYKSRLGLAGEAWGGACWSIRKALGKELADKILYRAWLNLPPPVDGADPYPAFANQILTASRELGGDQGAEKVREVFSLRGLVV